MTATARQSEESPEEGAEPLPSAAEDSSARSPDTDQAMPDEDAPREDTPDAAAPPTPPNPAPAAAAPPAANGVLAVSLPHALGYMLASLLIALGTSLNQGFLTVNINQIAGDLGVTTTDASWLIVAFIVPRCCLPVLLAKVRTQFGLRRFTEVGVSVYVVADFAALWMSDLRSAVAVELLSGCASAALSTLAFLYMLEPLVPAWKMRLGLPLAMTALLIGTSLARVISPALLGDGGLVTMHALVLGMALMSLALVVRLPLNPVPRAKVIKPLDLISFVLLTIGFSGIIVGCVMGPIHWWQDSLWIGLLIASGFAALTGMVIIELNRDDPMLDIRWLASPAVVHLTGALLIFRIILSEQSTGAPRMFQVLGLAPSQLVELFTVICIATVIGGLACIAWIKPGREPQLHLIALIMIATGAWMDAQSTIDTRPEQMIISQALIAFAGMLFLPPAMMSGLMSALKKGPQYLLSFIIVFISTQSLGGMIGSGLFTTLINNRQALHYQQLQEQLATTSPALTAEIAQRAAILAPQISDTVQLRAQAVSQIATNASNQAYVMAYNDAYFLTFLLAVIAACALCLHLFRDWLVVRFARRRSSSPAPQNAAPANA